MELLDRLFYPLLPGEGFSYLPYTILLFFTFVTWAYLFFSSYLLSAVKAVRWNQRTRFIVHRSFLTTVFLWAIVCLTCSRMEFFEDQEPAIWLIVAILAIPCSLVLMLLPKTLVTQMLDEMPDALLINANLFRLFIEPAIYLLVIEFHLPLNMSIQGLNPELMIAFSAPLLIVMAFNDDIKRYMLAIIWNFMGLASLSYYVYLLVSLPADPERYYIVGHPDLIMASFPFILIPGLYVPTCLLLHTLSIKQLLRDRRNPVKYDLSYLNPH